MKKIIAASIFLFISNTSSAQFKTQWVNEVQLGYNINQYDIDGNLEILRSKNNLQYYIGTGFVLQPQRKLAIKLMAGINISPQNLELQFQESINRKIVQYNYKYTENNFFIKTGLNSVIYLKKNHAEFGIVANYLFNISKFTGNQVHFYTEPYLDKYGNQNSALNASLFINQNSNLGNENNIIMLILGGVNYVYSFDNLLGNGKNLRIGVEINAKANLNSPNKEYTSKALFTTFKSNEQSRQKLDHSYFHDKNYSINLLVGIGL